MLVIAIVLLVGIVVYGTKKYMTKKKEVETLKRRMNSIMVK